MQKANFKDMSSAYREVIEQYSNDNILLNIIRASKDMPMSFLDIPSVVGSGSYTGMAGAAGVTYMDNADRLVGTSNNLSGTLGMSLNNSFTFTQASLDNAAFMSTFLKEVPLNAVNFQGSQVNLPKAVIFSLLIDSIELRTIDNEVMGRWRNNPLNTDYKEFQAVLYMLISMGLNTEPVLQKTPIGPAISEVDLRSSFAKWSDLLSKTQGDNFDFQKLEGNKDKGGYQLVKTSSSLRFCVNKYQTQEIMGSQLGKTAYCADSPKPLKGVEEYPKSREFIRQIISKNENKKDIQLLIKVRSIANVFDFLGNVYLAQNMDKPLLVNIATSEYSSLNQRDEKASVSFPLLRIYKGDNSKNSVSAVTYRGENYSIEEGDGSYSVAVLEFMSMLLTVSKTAGSIPASPAVLIR